MSRHVEVKESTRSLPVKLTDDEVLALGRRIAELMEQRQSAEALRKSQQKKLKSEIEELDKEIEDKRCAIRSCEERRLVEVELHFDYQRGIVETIRIDTGESVSIRPMDDEERQMGLRFDQEREGEAEDQPEQDEEPFDVEIKTQDDGGDFDNAA